MIRIFDMNLDKVEMNEIMDDVSREFRRNESIENEVTKMLLEYTAELGDVKEGKDKLIYELEVNNLLNYNSNKDIIDTHIKAIDNLTDSQISYDLNNMMWWLMYDKNQHGNKEWALKELEWLIKSPENNYFDYNGNIAEYKKYAIDKKINQLWKEMK